MVEHSWVQERRLQRLRIRPGQTLTLPADMVITPEHVTEMSQDATVLLAHNTFAPVAAGRPIPDYPADGETHSAV